VSRLGDWLARARVGSLPHASADRLVAAAQRRLAITTLALLVTLLAVVGATTALLAQQTLDASVDRTLETAAVAELERLHEAAGEGPTEQETEPSGSGAATSPAVAAPEGSDETEEAVSTPAAAASGPAAPGPSRAGGTDADDHAPAAADTFFLSLDVAGNVIANPARVAIVGLPDRAAAAAATLTGRDLRTIRAGDVPVRLLTIAVPAGEAG